MLLIWSMIFASAFAAIRLDIVRKAGVTKPNSRRIPPRATIYASLLNNITAGGYVASVTVGTPPQNIDLVIQTTSSDTWLLDSTADLCTQSSLQTHYGDGCKTPSSSSLSNDLYAGPADFSIACADGSKASGAFITDLFTIDNTTLRTQMGLAYNTSTPTGILGLGYPAIEASGPNLVYPTILDLLVSSNSIASSAYSLYLDELASSTGSLLLGGIDTAKFHGNLTIIPTVPKSYPNGTAVFTQFAVPLMELSITAQDGSITHLPMPAEPVTLDAGTTISYLPASLTTPLFAFLGAIDDTPSSGDVFIDCQLLHTAPNITINFHFTSSSTPTIKVLLRELIFDFGKPGFKPPENYQLPQLPFSNPCGFGIQKGVEGGYLLGDTFLRSAYAVFDLDANEVGLAQARFGPGEQGRVMEFESGGEGIASVSGIPVASTEEGSAVVSSDAESVTGCVSGASGSGSGSGCATGALPPVTSKGKSGAVLISRTSGWEYVCASVVIIVGMMLGGGLVVM
ncbi:aspartic-type endopeptidase protein [Rutstroemia sp. NJR-2017a BBW]|nr:aspartic-type endopeptidase protein [Rutstroemia sp. NJR-2017a BBW]